MPRPILGTPQSRTQIASPSVTPQSQPKSTLQGPKLLQRLRERRSAAYLQAVARLDAGVHHADRTGLDSLTAAIATEFPELGIEQRPLGMVCVCGLGPPYEVHICDLEGSIIEHFETFRSMPPLFEPARSLALHPRYTMIEVYRDRLCAIDANGEVSIIDR